MMDIQEHNQYTLKNIDLKGDKELNLENLKENIKEINNDRAKTKNKG